MLRFAIFSFAFFASLVSASAQTPIPSDSRLKSVVDNKTIRIAYRTDATPFSFKNENGEPAGFSLELCQLVTKSIEQQFGVADIKIEWVPVTCKHVSRQSRVAKPTSNVAPAPLLWDA